MQSVRRYAVYGRYIAVLPRPKQLVPGTRSRSVSALPVTEVQSALATEPGAYRKRLEDGRA